MSNFSQLVRSFLEGLLCFEIAHANIYFFQYKLFSDYDCPTVGEIEVPKVLGDLFESIVGAVLVDSGMSIDTVWKMVYRLMKRELGTYYKYLRMIWLLKE